MGSNLKGRLLGDSGLIENVEKPSRLNDIQNVKKIAAGSNHALVLTHDGRVYGAGGTGKGEIGSDGKGQGY